ncbi:Wzz/FepE/Etk N-terminal domain-containing protein [Wohlfahrtiimonas chitiniclastica]|uniref:Wzz/FepE/Etk N-terminal domain-containing protein n=1 Tax=Wohlfahrtiimonas chitiniclastica TaxID=400946 RepID=UPI001BCF3680|nr:Wzz/FepE/Etk N-terminal domain-containing protein [Wohlfahrtiimonas chitiniclastica]MBS7818539.1 LPS O-antigen chain length determinant protein WzzB [Wohlfahrtiimonas chitiniclastica]
MNNPQQNNLPEQNNDEIDLFELVATLWRGKWLIVGVTVVCTVVAIIASLMMTPVYKVKSVLKPVNSDKIFAINDTGVYSTTPEALFSDVEQEVYSYQGRENYLLDNQNLLQPLLENTTLSVDQVIAKFDADNFKITPSKKDDPIRSITIELTYPKGIDGVQIVNGFVKKVSSAVKEEIPHIIQNRIDQKKQELKDQITALRASYKLDIDSQIAVLNEQDKLRTAMLKDELSALRLELKLKRENRIAQLNEAISIATKLNYIKPTSLSAASDKKGSAEINGNVILTEVNNQTLPLYFMGTEALTAERNALLSRTNDDFTNPRIAEIEKELVLLQNNRKVELLKLRENHDLFLADITLIEKQIAKLNTIDPNITRFSVVSIDEKAQTPLKASKPNKALITIIGFLLGGMLGCMIVLIRQAVRNRKQLHNTN